MNESSGTAATHATDSVLTGWIAKRRAAAKAGVRMPFPLSARRLPRSAKSRRTTRKTSTETPAWRSRFTRWKPHGRSPKRWYSSA